MNGHWTEDDFIARLYGVGRTDHHLDDCPECRARQAAFQARREAVTRVPDEVEDRRLGEQRRAIYARLGHDERPAWRKTVPALAAAGVLVAGFLLVRPAAAPGVRATHREVAVMDNPAADAQFFQEVAALDQAPEPQAAVIASALFEQ